MANLLLYFGAWRRGNGFTGVETFLRVFLVSVASKGLGSKQLGGIHGLSSVSQYQLPILAPFISIL